LAGKLESPGFNDLRHPRYRDRGEDSQGENGGEEQIERHLRVHSETAGKLASGAKQDVHATLYRLKTRPDRRSS
jgi:hypothetical protein